MSAFPVTVWLQLTSHSRLAGPFLLLAQLLFQLPFPLADFSVSVLLKAVSAGSIAKITSGTSLDIHAMSTAEYVWQVVLYLALLLSGVC